MNIEANMSGNLWKLTVTEGEQIERGQEVAILESMKMEILINSPHEGTVKEIVKAEGDFVQENEVLMVLE